MQSEVCTVPERDNAIAELLRAIQSLSVEDLAALEAMLRNPSTRKSLWRMVRELLALRREALALPLFGDADSIEVSHQATQGAEDLSLRGELQRVLDSEETSREAFNSVFEDRREYPSTRDVVAALNRHFGLSLRYEKFRRRGRRDLLQSAWTQLSRQPASVRESHLRRFFLQHLDASGDTEGYVKLFRLLTSNASHSG